ncbi:SMP-30/gluconolactonase/LRE family protein [Cellvibrio sp. pealriver]|uniref:SMP-30/gluconolactonase/LRE family protein n=1 Tax=Cellvibrio sp. pealriver TaxID=1622269 RepID=UPI00066FCA8F|nr:SMP-30/gluconolactonase/LRE family protein [Cellvibrio sp. pealriver]
MVAFTLVDIVPCANTLGEGVQWNQQDGCFWWTDIHAQKLYRYQLDDKTLSHWDMPEKLGCFAFAKHDSRLLAAFASGFAWFTPDTGEVEWIAKPEAHLIGNRSNDGRCDRQGRFWMGSIREQQKTPWEYASLYSLSVDGNVQQHLTGLHISNALCWSPDSRQMYHADSPSHTINVYDFDAVSGKLSNKHVFAQTDAGIEPDGACVDAQGFVWNAQWGGSRVVRYSPVGEIDFILPMPVTQPTCVAFGGAQLNLLAVTSACVGLSDAALQQQPQAGHLFIFQTDITGLLEERFG